MQGVDLIGLNKSYGSVHVVKDINLSFGVDEFVVLVGPSGCGKTTTLRMVAGLESITSGDLMIGGVRANDRSPADRDIAMVFQNYALYPTMNVYENMAFGLRNRRVGKADADREVRRAAAVLGIEHLLERKPRQLSGGQQQRVALGRCLVRDPKLFLFDEPLSNLDAKLRLEMRQELKRLKTRITATSLYVTHDQVEAMTLGDRVVVMSHGVVEQCDTPENIYHRPRSVFVATFIGSPPMNLLTGTLAREGGKLFLRSGTARYAVPASLEGALPQGSSGEVILGIRPEHIRLSTEAAAGDAVQARVDITELLGSEQLVQVCVGDEKLTVTRVDPFLGLAPGQPVSLSLGAKHIHLFDPKTKLSLTSGLPRAAARQPSVELRPAAVAAVH